MAYTSWRGTVGVVKPTMRPGSLEEFIRMMPEGIGIIPLFIGFQRGTADEFQQAMKAYEERGGRVGRLRRRSDPPGRGAALHVSGGEG